MEYDMYYSSPTLLYVFLIALLFYAFKEGGIVGVFKICLFLLAIWLVFIVGMSTLIVAFANLHYIFAGLFFGFVIYCLIFRRK